jgi:hypothetical protein
VNLTIVLSGPKSSEPQVRTALASGGFTVLSTIDDHGLHPHASGEEPPQPVAFVTVTAEHEQLDAVAERAATLGYALRLHHETSLEREPSGGMQLAATLADLRREIEQLRARLPAS